MSKAKTEFNVSQIDGNSTFQPFSCWRKKTNKQERPQIVFLYDSHDINCYFSCKKYLENKSFSRGFMFLLVECMQFLIKLRRLSYFDLLNCFVVTWPACVVISTV